MTVMSECPNCGSAEKESEAYESNGNIPHWNEDLYCADCGTQVGGYSYPQV